MDDGLDLERIVNQTDMPTDRDVAMVARGRRQTAPEVRGHRVHFLTQILVKRSPLSQAGLLVGREPILTSEPCGRMVLVLIVPVVGGLAIFVIKLRVTLGVLVTAILLGRGAAGAHHNEYCSGADSCQPVSVQENTSLARTSILGLWRVQYTPNRPSEAVLKETLIDANVFDRARGLRPEDRLGGVRTQVRRLRLQLAEYYTATRRRLARNRGVPAKTAVSGLVAMWFSLESAASAEARG
jgi:hypothetical protein